MEMPDVGREVLTMGSNVGQGVPHSGATNLDHCRSGRRHGKPTWCPRVGLQALHAQEPGR